MPRRTRPQAVEPAVRGQLSAWLKGVDEGRVTRRDFILRTAALGISTSSIGMLLAACGDGKAATESASPLASEMPAAINIFNWAEYLSPKVKKQFKQKTKCAVNETFFESNEQCVAAVKAHPEAYDICFPEEWAAEVLMKAGLLRPLDMSLIPNFANVTQPEFRTPPYDPQTDGNKYTVPYMFGSIGFAARLDLVSNPPNGWQALYDSEYKQKIGMLDGSREVLAPALFLAGSSPNTTDQSELDAATGEAIKQKPLVGAYDSENMLTNITGGEFVYVQCWDGDAIGATNEVGLSKVRYVMPQEGYIVWADALCIPKNAPNPYAAHAFLDFLLDAEVAAENANNTGYQPVVEAADPMIKSLVQRAMRPTADQLANGIYIKDLGDFNAAYDAAYEKVTKA
jgi:spermidine/putrescine-binding protein